MFLIIRFQMRRALLVLLLFSGGCALPFPSIEIDPSMEEALSEDREVGSIKQEQYGIQDSVEDFPSPKDIPTNGDIFADSASLEVNNTLACDDSNAPGR